MTPQERDFAAATSMAQDVCRLLMNHIHLALVCGTPFRDVVGRLQDLRVAVMAPRRDQEDADAL